jgi:hypothetical protein
VNDTVEVLSDYLVRHCRFNRIAAGKNRNVNVGSHLVHFPSHDLTKGKAPLLRDDSSAAMHDRSRPPLRRMAMAPKPGAEPMNYKIDTSVSFGTRAAVAANSKAPARSGVRKATEVDIGDIVALLAVMLKESTYRAIPLHEDKLRAFLRFTSTDKNHACLVYQARDGRIDGVVLGFVTEHWFSLEKSVGDLAPFVRPERRGGIAAARLRSAFKT